MSGPCTPTPIQRSPFSLPQTTFTHFPLLFSYYLTSYYGVPSANYQQQARDLHSPLAALVFVLGFLVVVTYLILLIVRTVILTRRH